jgi:hypothetical protein
MLITVAMIVVGMDHSQMPTAIPPAPTKLRKTAQPIKGPMKAENTSTVACSKRKSNGQILARESWEPLNIGSEVLR